MLDNELREAKRLAREAGAILMKIYATDFAVAYKGVRDPVTDADKQANAFLVKELSRLFPDDAIIAEESPDLRDDGGAARCWYVDPVDGTKEFISKNGEFSVMIGLAIEHESRLGVVYQPAKDKLYSGVVGQGAWLEEGGEERALTVSEVADPKQLSLVVSRSHRSASTSAFVERVGITKESKSGSVGLKVGLIAERAADLYVHISDKSMKWDACGPEAILRGAGGRFTDLAGRPYRYGDGPLANVGGILAVNAAAFDAVVEDAHAVAKEEGLAV